jgi:hypothetical protein
MFKKPMFGANCLKNIRVNKNNLFFTYLTIHKFEDVYFSCIIFYWLWNTFYSKHYKPDVYMFYRPPLGIFPFGINHRGANST